MIQKTYISHLTSKKNETVELAGWVVKVRDSGKICFMQFRDGTGFIQVVGSPNDMNAEEFEIMRHLSIESAVQIKGIVVENAKSPTGIEIIAKELKLVSKTENYPITPKEHGTDFLMDIRHLWIRSPRQHAILRIRHQIITAIRHYFDDLDFTLTDAPIFTANECEGSSTLFETEYFGESAFLSQSGQLYMEAACQAVGRAYCFGPTFRAEKSNTRRHLTEFWMVEPEVAYMDLEGCMELAEGLIQAIVKRVLERCPEELRLLERSIEPLESIIAGAFPRISYDEAVEIIKKSGAPFTYGDDFGGADETIISNTFNRPVIVHSYPTAIKPFYMKKDPKNPLVVRNMDVLAPEGYGEVIGGGQRDENYETLLEAIKESGLNPETYSWYLDVRRYGAVPHAGFGLGVERCVAWITGISHVRETGLFPRMPQRLRP